MSSEKRQSVRDAYTQYLKDPNLNEGKLVSCLENYRTDWLGERQGTHDSIWRDNLSFYAGNHYIRDRSPSNGYRVKLRENHTNNIIQRMISVFVQNMPICRVFPSSVDRTDVDNAESTEFFGKYIWRVKKLEQLFIKYVKYTAIFGNGFIIPSYDPDAGGEISLDASETESGDPEIRKYRGDIAFKVADPFKIIPRPGIEEMDDMYDIIHSDPVNKSYLEAKYGCVEADPAKGYNVYSGEMRKDEEMVMQHHYYHKSTPWFPEGLYVCWAGKKLLRVRKANKAESKRLPTIHLPFDKPPMRFWAISSIEQVMDLQEQLDRAASMIIEARNLIARPRVISSHEAAIPSQMITDRPGDHLRYKMAGGKPEFYVPNFNFSEMAAHKADVRNAMGQVSGISSASRGEVPQATRTALALQLVLEQDRSQYLPFIKTFHSTISDTMMQGFENAAEFIDSEDPRMVKIEGVEGSKPFHGGMVPTPLDIYLEDTNPLGWTAAGRVEQVGHLIERGLITDRNQALEMLHINSPDPSYKTIRVSKQTASRENQQLRKGVFMEVMSEDIDPIHLDEHAHEMQGFAYKEYPRPVKDAFEAHVNLHKDRMQQGQAPAPGPGGGPPKKADSEAAQAILAAPQPNMEGMLSG